MIFLLSLFLTTFSFAQSGLSPIRGEGVDYKATASLKTFSDVRANLDTAYGKRAEQDQIDWSQIPEINQDQLQEFFVMVRDEKKLMDLNYRARRLPWFFPDSGCFARAQYMSNRMNEILGRTPMKIFAFGNLVAKTDYHRTGWVHWWYHVAPIVRVNKNPYVIDPSLDHELPIPVQTWIQKMNAVPEISICAANSYDPNSRCDHTEDNQKDRAIRDMVPILDFEWSRLVELGKDPNKKLE